MIRVFAWIGFSVVGRLAALSAILILPALNLTVAAAEPATVEIVPADAIEWGAGCSHYLEPVRQPSDYAERLLFHWGYPALYSLNGTCVANCKPQMKIRGRLVSVEPQTKWPEELVGADAKVGDTFVESYRYGSIVLRFENRVTFVCPPASAGSEPCEVLKFDGVLTVTDGSTMETRRTKGECGA